MSRMMRFLVTFLWFNFVALTAGAVIGEDFNHGDLKKHLAFVYNQNGSCSGVILEDRRVLTAAHCYQEVGVLNKRHNVFVSTISHQNSEKADRKKNPSEYAGVVKKDKENDLMLLEASVIGSPVEFADAVLDEEIMIVGYPLGEYRAVRGRVTGLTGHVIVWTDNQIMAGSSGAAAFNKKGQVVGIVSRARADGFHAELHLRHARVVEQFLGDDLPKAHDSQSSSGSSSSCSSGCFCEAPLPEPLDRWAR